MIKEINLKKIIWTIDLITFTIVFLFMNHEKFETPIPRNNYFYLYLIFIMFWSVFSLYYDRIDSLIHKSLDIVFRITLWSFLLSLLFVVITISLSDLWSISRLFIVKFTAIMVIYSLIIAFVIKKFIIKAKKNSININYQSENTFHRKFYLKWLIPGISFLLLTYVVITYMKSGYFYYNSLHEQNLLILVTSWGIGTLLTNRYKEPNSINHYYEIAPYIKAFILTTMFITFFYYSFRLNYESINIIYKAGFLHSGLEIIFFYIYFSGKSKKSYYFLNKKENHSTLSSTQKLLELKNDTFKKNGSYNQHNLYNSLNSFEYDNNDKLTNFIWKSIQSNNLSKNKITILKTNQTMNIELLFEQSRELIINIEKINNMRRINEYLLSAYSRLESGGLLVGNIIPLENLKIHLRSKMPHFLYSIVLPLHFLLHRVFPKLPITKKLYFLITKGNNRIISKSELLGRLSFCGYSVISEITIKNKFHFICKKKKTISNEESPSYGPIVKLKRIGYNGEILYIYKLRTMYPYSEFIQSDIYEKYNLDTSGKIKGDNRITSWGKIFRKYFLDELPQIYNWLNGDLNIVGVRALSEHYFSLYPKDVQQERIKFKPGLIPPYYADLPNSFEEIIESEMKYLKQKEKAPFLTDLRYFFNSVKNILILGARSK